MSHEWLREFIQMAAMRSVAFDLEGTVVDLEGFHFLSFELAMDAFGVPITVVQIAQIPGVIGGGDPFIAARLAEQYGLDSEKILKLKGEHFNAMLWDGQIAPREGVVDIIAVIRSMNLPIAVGSLTPRERGMLLLRRAGLWNLFPSEHIVFREDAERPKPHPDVYLRTARLMGTHPRNQIVFEDSPVGVQAACAAGSTAIAMPTPLFREQQHLDNLTAAGARHTFISWKDL